MTALSTYTLPDLAAWMAKLVAPPVRQGRGPAGIDNGRDCAK